jgi:hypothetical protein
MLHLILNNKPMKLFSKFTLLAGVFVLLSSSCMIGNIADRIAEATDDNNIGSGEAILIVTNTYPVSTVQDLRISTSGGSIEVAGDANQHAVIEMYVKEGSRNLSKSEIQEILDRDYEIRIEQRGGTLEAYAKRKNNLNWRNGLSISFKVQTGNKVTTDLSTSGGSIRLAHLSGRQNFKTSGGSLEVENLDGNITGRTSGGGIRAYDSKEEKKIFVTSAQLKDKTDNP